MYVCMYIVSMDVSIYVCKHVRVHSLSIDLSIYIFMYLSTYLSMYLPTYLPTYLSVRLASQEEQALQPGPGAWDLICLVPWTTQLTRPHRMPCTDPHPNSRRRRRSHTADVRIQPLETCQEAHEAQLLQQEQDEDGRQTAAEPRGQKAAKSRSMGFARRLRPRPRRGWRTGSCGISARKTEAISLVS